MIVLCHVSSLSSAQLQRAFPPPHVVSSTKSWDVLLARARETRYDVIIVDPCVGDERLARDRLRALEATGATPLMAYVSVTAAAMRAVQTLSQLGAHEVIIRGVDDTPSELAAAVHRVVAASAGNRLVGSVGTPLGTLPTSLAAALEMMFHRPERVRSVADLALAASTTRRSLDRWLARAGLASARTLLSCARANAAFHLIAAGRLRTAQAAALVGYASPRSLTRELHALTGCSATSIPARLTPERFVSLLGTRLLRSPATSRVAASSY